MKRNSETRRLVVQIVLATIGLFIAIVAGGLLIAWLIAFALRFVVES